MAIPPNARAGWYPDPAVPGKKRYWDGRAWTDRTVPVTPPAPATLPDAAAPDAAAPAVPSAPPTPKAPPITTGVIVAGTVIAELGGL